MSINPKAEKIVVVTGDVTMDWNLMRIRRSRDSQGRWGFEDTTRACWQRGGASLLADLIAAVAEGIQHGGQASYSLRQTAAPLRHLGPPHPPPPRGPPAPTLSSFLRALVYIQVRWQDSLAGGGIPGNGPCPRRNGTGR